MSSPRSAARALASLAAVVAMTLAAGASYAQSMREVPRPAPSLEGGATSCELILEGKNAGSFTLLSVAPATSMAARERHPALVLEHPVGGDAAFRAWAESAGRGARPQDVRLQCRKAGQAQVVIYALHNAMVSEVASVQGPGPRPLERVTLTYESLQIERPPS